MTNPPNEFAQQLDELFRELHNVLQDNLKNKVSEETFKNLVGHIQNIEKRVSDTAQRMDELEKKTQNLEEKFMRMQQTLQQSAVRSAPSIQPQVITTQPQVVSQTPEHSNPNQFGINHDEVTLSEKSLAGRTNKGKTFKRKFFSINDKHPLLQTITSSVNYNQSIHKDTDRLVENTANLMTDDGEQNFQLALELCMLIDLQNLHLLGYKNDDLYDSYTSTITTKSNNKSTNRFSEVLEGYGFQQADIPLEMRQTAISNLMNLQGRDIDARIQGSYLQERKLFQEFQEKLRQTRNNIKSTETVSDPALTQASNQGN